MNVLLFQNAIAEENGILAIQKVASLGHIDLIYQQFNGLIVMNALSFKVLNYPLTEQRSVDGTVKEDVLSTSKFEIQAIKMD